MYDKNVVVIGCGGFGANRVKALAAEDKGNEVQYMVVDSSGSNLLDVVDDKLVVLRVPNLDGAGKERKAAYKEAAPFIPQILPKIPSSRVTILVYSTSGGTGSVVGPLLNHQLQARGNVVINVCLATTYSLDESRNTINTLDTLGNMAISAGVPVHVMLEEDKTNAQRKEMDEGIRHHIMQAIRIGRHEYDGLDTADIANWLNHHRNGVPAGLTLIERFDDLETMAKMDGAINLLSLVTDASVALPDIGVLNNAMGVVDGSEKSPQPDMHFITTMKGMDAFRRLLQERVKQFETRLTSLTGGAVFGKVENADGDGFVL